MSFFTKKPQSALGTKPSKPAAPKKATVVTKTLVKVPVKTRLGPPPPTSSAAPSSSSRPSSSATKRKPAPKTDERPPKVRRTSSFNKVQEQRVLPESDSSSDEEGGSSGRDKTPLDLTAEEYVVERPVAGPSSVSVEIWEGLVSAEQIVRQNQAKYKPYFKPDPDHPEPVVVTLEYPSPGAQESFLLLTPKSQGEFNPISEAVRIMQVVLKNFVPPSDSVGASPCPSDPASRPSTPAAAPSPNPLSPLNPNSTSSSPKTSASSEKTETAQILRLLERSIASNILSLPLFLQAVNRYNALVVRCRESGDISRYITNMSGLKSDVWSLLTDQTYQRIVGPSVPILKDYKPFSSNVYGELMPPFLSSLISLTHLTPASVLVDLGSGVGNCCLQAALQVGCEAWGWEMMAGASRLAREQLEEARRRWAMWGLSAGRVEIREGDFCVDPEVGEVLKRADVLICNNYAFEPELNERLSLFFLELKDGARVISLRRFVPQDFRLNERNCSSPGAIIRTEAHRFPTQAVSWTHEGGQYFVQTVDRSMLQRYQAAARQKEIKKRIKKEVKKEVKQEEEEEESSELSEEGE